MRCKMGRHTEATGVAFEKHGRVGLSTKGLASHRPPLRIRRRAAAQGTAALAGLGIGINRSGVGEGTGREDTTNLLRQQVASLCDEANRLPARHMALHTGQHSSPDISRV